MRLEPLVTKTGHDVGRSLPALEHVLATVRVNTSQRLIEYRGFTIQEAYVAGKGNVWEWAHWDCAPAANFGPHGECQTLFECVDAVNHWYQQEARA